MPYIYTVYITCDNISSVIYSILYKTFDAFILSVEEGGGVEGEVTEVEGVDVLTEMSALIARP